MCGELRPHFSRYKDLYLKEDSLIGSVVIQPMTALVMEAFTLRQAALLPSPMAVLDADKRRMNPTAAIPFSINRSMVSISIGPSLEIPFSISYIVYSPTPRAIKETTSSPIKMILDVLRLLTTSAYLSSLGQV
jgi:hypothetical protein